MKTCFKYILLSFISTLLFSCSHKLLLEENEILLIEQDFKGNTYVLNEELANLIPLSQRPNKKPLNLPWFQFTPKVWLYNFGLNNFDEPKQNGNLLKLQAKLSQYPINFTADTKMERKKKKFTRKIAKVEANLAVKTTWLWRSIGEPQTVIQRGDAITTANIIEKYLRDIGYMDAKVDSKLDTLLDEDKYKLSYLINEGTPYIVDTVFYEIEDSNIERLLQNHDQNEQLIPGDLFDIRKVNAEKIRIEKLAKENGYYNFLNEFIIHEAINANFSREEFREKKHGNLRFTIVNPEEQNFHNKYRIKEIVLKGFDPYNDTEATKADTVKLNDVDFITLNSRIPIKLLDKKIITRPGQLYNIANISETQRQIGLLNQFSFASSQVQALSNDEVRIEYFAPQLPKYSFSTGPGVNYVYNGGPGFIGFGIPVSLSVRNMIKRMELFEISASVFREGQPSTAIGSTEITDTWEIGTNVSMSFPNISFFGKDVNSLKLKNPKTQFGAGFNYSEPYWGKRFNFNVNTTYRWQPTPKTTLFFSVLDAHLINTHYNLDDPAGRRFYLRLLLLEKQGNNLKTTLDPQFVSSFNGSFVYNDQSLEDPYADATFFRIFAESGGTFLNFANDKSQIKFIENLFPPNSNSPDSVRQYFQFLKTNIDYRRYINLAPKTSLAYRLNVGIAFPYGVNKALPYEKNFFVGGSNSVRAWAPRSLGVGSVSQDTLYALGPVPQAGDILLEGSIEIRKKVARFFGDIQLAFFIDFGNIWKWYNIDSESHRDKANFDFSRFYKEIAVGTGLGIRYDLGYFQFRFDWGIKVMDPARPEGDRFVLDEFSFKKNNPYGSNLYGLNFNLGIGYPF